MVVVASNLVMWVTFFVGAPKICVDVSDGRFCNFFELCLLF